MTKRMAFRYVNETVGTFVILCVGLFLVTVYLAGHAQEWFRPVRNVKIVLPAAGTGGLKETAEVRMMDMPIGYVKRVEMDSQGQVTAILGIRDRFFGFVRDDSVAHVKKGLGIVGGDAYVEVSKGTGQPLPKKDAAIKCEVEKDVQSALLSRVDELADEAVGTAREYRKLAEQLQAPEGQLQMTLAELRQISARLNAGEGLAGQLLTSKKLASDVTDAVTDIQRATENIRTTTESLAQLTKTVEKQSEALPTMISETEKTLQEAQDVLRGINETNAALPPLIKTAENRLEELPILQRQAVATLHEIERLVVGMQRHWLLKGYVPSDTSDEPLPVSEFKGD